MNVEQGQQRGAATGADRARVLVVIPARGGSKGIPRKNLAPVGGVSLVGRAVRSAHAARLVDVVVVSTDDDEIAAEAQSWGAGVVRRPEPLASDVASSESVLVHALEHVGAGGAGPDVCVLVQCTSPFIDAADIDGPVAQVLDDRADCALTVTPTHGFLWRHATGDTLTGVNHDESGRLRRQDREPEYLETGAVYAMRAAGFLEHRHRFFGRVGFHVVPSGRALEIDDLGELELARTLARSGGGSLPGEVGAIVFDFDGVMTDDRAIVSQDGVESVTVSRSDGMGVERLRRAGVPMLVLSKERNPVVARRCEKLQIEVLHGIEDKRPALEAWLAERAIPVESLVYVGNDVNDIDCLELAGCAVIPSDAHRDVRRHADVVLSRPGGRGAVRELADLVLAQGADRQA